MSSIVEFKEGAITRNLLHNSRTDSRTIGGEGWGGWQYSMRHRRCHALSLSIVQFTGTRESSHKIDTKLIQVYGFGGIICEIYPW